MISILKILFFPFSILYGLFTFFRNILYDFNILKSSDFETPVICIGNLTMGGSGKTPLTQHLIDLLAEDNNRKVAVLSRGYGRNTTGFLEVKTDTPFISCGDEPLIYKKNNPDIIVAVCENRAQGIKKIINITGPDVVILLDDAFQHRSVKPKISILLTEYKDVFKQNFVLPSGTLREYSSSYKRADIIVVTKAPKDITDEEKTKIIKKISPCNHQKIYCSHINYRNLKPLNKRAKNKTNDSIQDVIFFAGIANPKPAEEYLKSNYVNIQTHYFKDHHIYREDELIKIRNNAVKNDSIIITTEKDAVKFGKNELEIFENTPFFSLPIDVAFEDNVFDEQIKLILKSHKIY